MWHVASLSLTLQRLVQADAQLAQAYTLAQGFAKMIRERLAARLETWLAAVARTRYQPTEALRQRHPAGPSGSSCWIDPAVEQWKD